MGSAKAGAIKLGGLMLVGGLLTGGLLAMTTPTQMKRQPEDFRAAVGVREVAVSDAAIPVYAPPQDLTPMPWQPASEANPYAPTPDQAVDTTSDLMPDDSADTDPQLAAETLPPEILSSRTSPDALVADDEAASSAQAAQATVADVQAAKAEPAPSIALGGAS